MVVKNVRTILSTSNEASRATVTKKWERAIQLILLERPEIIFAALANVLLQILLVNIKHGKS